MKIFILPRVEECTEEYHTEGGLVVLAKDIDKAKELIKAETQARPTEEEWASATIFDVVGEHEPAHWIMSDTGCC